MRVGDDNAVCMMEWDHMLINQLRKLRNLFRVVTVVENVAGIMVTLNFDHFCISITTVI